MNSKPILVANDGARVAAIDYWDHPLAARGLVFVSINAGALRLLVPDALVATVTQETASATRALFDRPVGALARGQGAVELVFDDGTESPFCLSLARAQIDRPGALAIGNVLELGVWSRQGLVRTMPCEICALPG